MRAHSFRLYKPIPARIPGTEMMIKTMAKTSAINERIVAPFASSINPPTNLRTVKIRKAISRLNILSPICSAATILMCFSMMVSLKESLCGLKIRNIHRFVNFIFVTFYR